MAVVKAPESYAIVHRKALKPIQPCHSVFLHFFLIHWNKTVYDVERKSQNSLVALPRQCHISAESEGFMAQAFLRTPRHSHLFDPGEQAGPSYV